ncbi:hypothetical protein PVL29_023204 [Vitis rotundifolia]|uniref:SF4 helicase domain-containing protein n=1 Tax=Vitis rotundifolia TaxID=103349 RepID=A0AA38YN80_VITRO|nr:hypothetical protein PVL29_023204 [Vitis rotundifolia]
MPFSPLLLRLRDSDPEMLLRQQHRVVISSSPTILVASKQLLKSTPLTLPLRLNLSSPITISAFPLKSTSRILPVSLKTSALPYTSHSNVPRPVYSENPEDTSNFSARFNVLKKKLEAIGFDSQMLKTGQYNNLLCPACKGGYSMEKSLSLSITLDRNCAVWTCHRGKCGWRGDTQAFVNGGSSYGRLNQITKIKPKREITEKSLGLEPLCREFIIAFTYRRNGVLVSCKYWDVNKNFWQEEDTEKIFYGVDDIKEASDIIIVEGEIDKLSMEEAGFYNCVSVPDGAPGSVSTKVFKSDEEDIKYQYLWNCKEYLEKASRIILATDGDSPGLALAEELARRLGRERCWRVKWPKKNEVDHFKDANEVLMYLGPDVLKEVIENVVPGELTIVTGVPNSGKSEWIDALLCNINRSVGWRFALCSMENKVREHARKLLEKHIKKPFFDAGYGESIERMSIEEFELGKKWLSETFYLIRCENDSLPNIKWVLDLAKAAVLRHGVRGLVIDPYNELDHQRPANQTETEYVSQMLTIIKRFAQHHSCHVWFVAHPRQLHHWDGGPPNMYDISGSAHFINKCDNGIVIHRNRNPDTGPVDQVQVCVRKVRNKVIGTTGDAFLSYDRYGPSFSHYCIVFNQSSRKNTSMAYLWMCNLQSLLVFIALMTCSMPITLGHYLWGH